MKIMYDNLTFNRFWMLPSVILKKLIIENITAARIMDLEIAHAIEFMIERVENTMNSF